MTLRSVSLLLLVLLAGALQGCFPVIVAGVGTGAVMAQDRRPGRTFIEDEKIEILAADRIGKKFKANMHVNVTSLNRKALISGGG